MKPKKFKFIMDLVIIFFAMILTAWAAGDIKDRWFEWVAGIYITAVIVLAFIPSRK